MIRKLSIVAFFTGFGHFINLAAIKILSTNLPSNIFAYIGELDALVIFLTSMIAFGLQLSTTRELALLDNWKEELYITQQARLTLSLFLLIFGVSGFFYSKNILFLFSPLIALNADYALYGRGKPIEAAFYAFIRLIIPAIVLIVSSIYFEHLILELYICSLFFSYALTGILISRSLEVNYFVLPNIKSLKKYIDNFGLGIASVSFIFLGVGLVNIIAYFFTDETTAISYVVLKVYIIFKGVKRILTQSFFKDIMDKSIAIKVDYLGIITGVFFLFALSVYKDFTVPMIIDEKYLLNSSAFIMIGIIAFINSFTTSVDTLLLLNKQDSKYISNIIISTLVTIFITITLSFLSIDSAYCIMWALFIGEILLSILNLISLNESNFLIERLRISFPFLIASSVFFLLHFFKIEILIISIVYFIYSFIEIRNRLL